MKSKMPTSRAKTAYGLLSDVKRVILAEPLRLDMGIVCLRGSSLQFRDRVPDCGTVGCIAGWALSLKGRTSNDEENHGNTRDAQELLGLDFKDAQSLFFVDRLVQASNKQTAAHAKATARHITRFQKAHAAQLKAKRV